MNKLIKSAVSLLAGLLAAAVVGVGVTEVLTPHIWPAAMVGLPVGLVAGAVAVPLAYLGLTYRSERQSLGRASATTRRRLRTLLGATAGFVLGGAVGMSVLWTQAVGLAAAMLFVGLPAGLFAAAVAGYLAFRRSPVDRQRPGSSPR